MASNVLYPLSSGYRIDPQLGLVYDAVPRVSDDLTVIPAIGPRQAAGLNRLGVYFIEQVATWTDSQTAAVSDALSVPVSTTVRDCWRTQARTVLRANDELNSTTTPGDSTIQPSPSPPLPASGSRTVTVLLCALLIGCFFVWSLNRHTTPAITGILAADITILRVPSDSRLLSSHVTAGDEVFTGEILLTVEESEPGEQIDQQRQHVQKLDEELQRAKTKATLELEWRIEQLDLDVLESKRRAQFFREFYPSPTGHQPAVTIDYDTWLPLQVCTVSKSNPGSVISYPKDPLLFINGITGTTTLNSLSADSLQGLRSKHPTPADTNVDLFQLEVQNLEARIEQLTRRRSHLPAQINRATGVELLQSEFDAAKKRYTQMKNLSRNTNVLCPNYGRITQLQFREGDNMRRGDVMLKIVHTDRPYIILKAPVESINKLVPNTQLTVLFPGHDPCQGIVTEVPAVTARQMSDGGDVASVRVEPTGRKWPRPAVGTRVDILTQRETISVH
ncbi:MAG: hypothetical protein MK110_17275 [Fuerstiella sp.]|nr:hypothetical protein [Fuerstiella sp.]